MWPFKKKAKPDQLSAAQQRYINATCDGVVDKVMYDYITIAGKQHFCKAPLVELGQTVKKGQIVGK